MKTANKLNTKFLQISLHFQAHGGELGFEAGDVCLYGIEVDLGFLLEGIDIAGDVEIEVVVGDFLRGGAVGLFLDGLEGLIGGGDPLDVFLGEEVLVFGVFVFAGGINEEDIAVACKSKSQGDIFCAYFAIVQLPPNAPEGDPLLVFRRWGSALRPPPTSPGHFHIVDAFPSIRSGGLYIFSKNPRQMSFRP